MSVSSQAHYSPNSPLGTRLAVALNGASQLDVAVAYAKRSGVDRLLAIGLPRESRFVVGTGFALTDPAAVEALAANGCNVRVVMENRFHPKLYVVGRADATVVFSGSGNLTGGGLGENVEQYEELRLRPESDEARAQASRYAALWALGIPLAEVQRSGAWDAYIQWFAERSKRERQASGADAASARRVRELLPRSAPQQGGPLADRLREVISRATGVPAEPHGSARVMLDSAIHTVTFQRAALEDFDAVLLLSIWPGELKRQAVPLYSGDRASQLLAAAADQGWEVSATPHLAFYNSNFRQRLYMHSTLTPEEYVRQWSGGDLSRVGAYAPEAVRRELWPWLRERGYASAEDDLRLDWFLGVLSTRAALLRPGLHVTRGWDHEEARELDELGRLPAAVRRELAAMMASLGEPALPSPRP